MNRKTYKNLHINGQDYYGKHLMLTATSCNKNLLSIELVSSFLRDLPNKIDMIRHGEPLVGRFGEGIEVGISGVQLITTSAITVHTNDQFLDLYLDVFSCKWFDTDFVKKFVTESFGPKGLEAMEVLRK